MKYHKSIEQDRTLEPPRNRATSEGFASGSLDGSKDGSLNGFLDEFVDGFLDGSKRGSVGRPPKQQPRKASPRNHADPAPPAAPSEKFDPPRKPRGPVTTARIMKMASGLALVAAGFLFMSWTGHRMDRQMRDEIFLQAKMVAQAVDIENVMALSGSEADLGSREYRKIKEQLILIRQVAPKCRFIYLMGRRPDGTLFFFVDSEPSESADYSPPGQAYGEATKDDYRVFETGSGNASGVPYKDRWGTWITALVPVFHPNTDKVLAVLGMDFNAATWKWDVANRAALPASPAAFLILLGLYILFFPARIALR